MNKNSLKFKIFRLFFVCLIRKYFFHKRFGRSKTAAVISTNTVETVGIVSDYIRKFTAGKRHKKSVSANNGNAFAAYPSERVSEYYRNLFWSVRISAVRASR